MEFVFVVPRAELFPDCYPHGLQLFEGGFSEKNFAAKVARHGFYVERERAERTPEWKQVIPYSVVLCDGKVFLLRRTKGGGEARLFDKLSIGVGGHINPIDSTLAEEPTPRPTQDLSKDSSGATRGDNRSSAASGSADADLDPERTATCRSSSPSPGGSSGASTTWPASRNPIPAATQREVAEELHLNGPYDLQPVGVLNDDSNAVGAVHVGLVQILTVTGTVGIRETDQLEGQLVSLDSLLNMLQTGDNFETWSALLVPHLAKLIPQSVS